MRGQSVGSFKNLKSISGVWLAGFLVVFFLLGNAVGGWSATVCHYPNQTGPNPTCTDITWPTDGQWVTVSSETEGTGDTSSPSQYDFVGNATCPGIYYYNNGTYLFFRMRVNYSGTVTYSIGPSGGTFNGTMFLFVRTSAPNPTYYPQNALVWDTKGNGGNANHGLEASVYDVAATTWNAVRMNDLDGTPASKGAVDIDGLSIPPTAANKEGFVRTVDGVSCSGLGTTTFIDFAVKCGYFERTDVIAAGMPNLCSTPVYVQSASLDDLNDHNTLSDNKSDVGRGVASLASTQTITSGDWGSPTAIDLLSFTGRWSGSDIVLNWETGAEINNAGFHLWRAWAQAGPYFRITTGLIEAEGGAAQGAKYSYTDKNRLERPWYYKLEDINNEGVSTFHGPIAVKLTSATASEIALLSPADGSALPSAPPTFRWSAEGFDGYRLQFCASSSFTGRVMTMPLGQWGTKTSYVPSRFVWTLISMLGRRSSTIYWRVVGKQGKTTVTSEPFEMNINRE